MLQDKEELTQSTFKREKTVMDSSIKKKEGEVEVLHVSGLSQFSSSSHVLFPGKSIHLDYQNRGADCCDCRSQVQARLS